MKLLIIGCLATMLAACAGLQLKPQTPQQVATNFCSQATTTISDLKTLSDLTPNDQALVSKADVVISGFCTGLGTNPDLANLNANVTKVVLSLLSQSTIKNKDQYEIALIVAQGAVTAYLNNVQQ